MDKMHFCMHGMCFVCAHRIQVACVKHLRREVLAVASIGVCQVCKYARTQYRLTHCTCMRLVTPTSVLPLNAPRREKVMLLISPSK